MGTAEQRTEPWLTLQHVLKSSSALIDQLRAHYVFPLVAEQIGTELRQQLTTETYASAPTAQAFCTALTQTLQTVGHDKHLNVRYSAEAHLSASDGPSNTDTLAEDVAWREAYREEARLQNVWLCASRTTPGNIALSGPARGFEDSAIRRRDSNRRDESASHTSALIVDLRQNGARLARDGGAAHHLPLRPK